MIYPPNSLLPFFLLLVSCVGISVADEQQDGFVERAVQIVIRDDVAAITYSFGLNENTMRQVLDEWNSEPDAVTDLREMSSGDSSVESTVDAFREAFPDRLAKSLQVSVDGKPLNLQLVSIEPSARHHYSFVANLEFQLPVSKSQKLTIVDVNFQKLMGAARYALKASGSTIIFNSNVAPIIVRAGRHDLSLLAPEKREEICTIKATIASVPNQSARR